jgi:hypothetical protein
VNSHDVSELTAEKSRKPLGSPPGARKPAQPRGDQVTARVEISELGRLRRGSVGGHQLHAGDVVAVLVVFGHSTERLSTHARAGDAMTESKVERQHALSTYIYLHQPTYTQHIPTYTDIDLHSYLLT